MKIQLSELRQIISEALDRIDEKKKKRSRAGTSLRKGRHKGPGRPRKEPSNPLAKYIDDHASASEEIADKFGVEPQTLDKYARGDGVPSLDMASKIEKKTNGAVPITTWI